MPRPTIDLTGKVIGRWTVLRRATTGPGRTYWLCRCECGTERPVEHAGLLRGLSRSCGCFLRERASQVHRKHGAAGGGVSEYHIWASMKRRCHAATDAAYPDYGGRGIEVCGRWRESFEAFLADMGRRPGPDYTVDRIDNDGPYCPENCRWATRTEQARNRRSSRIIVAGGVAATLVEWAERLGVGRRTIEMRLKLGWSEEAAVTAPPDERRRPKRMRS